jgi:hypothetical protein
MLYRNLSEADRPALVLQLSRIKAIGNLSGHALVSIVRLTVETNLVTSKQSPGLRCLDAPPLSHARSASVSIVSLLMVAVYPVSDSVCHVPSSVEIERNTGEELVCVPVRI